MSGWWNSPEAKRLMQQRIRSLSCPALMHRYIRTLTFTRSTTHGE